MGVWEDIFEEQALLGKWICKFSSESTALWHKVFLSIYGQTLMIEMQTFQLGGHIITLGRPMLKSSKISQVIPFFWWVMGPRSIFQKTCEGINF